MSFRLRVLLIACGIVLHSRLPALPQIWLPQTRLPEPAWPEWVSLWVWLVAVLVAGLAGWWWSARADKTPLKNVVAGAALLTAGFSWAMLLALWQFAERLPLALEGEDFWLIGRIEGLPLVDQGVSDSGNRRSRRVDLRVEKTCLRLLPQQCEEAGYAPVLAGTLVTLNDYGGLPLQAGERWQLRVRVNRPHGFANPGGNDFEAGQFQRGVMARGYIRETRLNQLLGPEATVRARLAEVLNISRWRAALAARIDASGSSPEALDNRGVIKALVLGDRQDISTAQWTLFTATGTNHLVVISGLHVGFVAMCVWYLVNRLLRLFPGLLLRWPAQHGAAIAAIGAAALYSFLAGFSLPTQRALIMVTVLMLARLSGRQTRPGDSLALAALIILVLDPLAVVTAGFWLSFVAVASLFLVFAGADHRQPQGADVNWVQRVWQRWVQPQWAVSAGLLLPLIVWTGQTSLNAPLANIVAIPLVSLLVVPLSLLGSLLLVLGVPGGDSALLLADRLLSLLQWVLGAFVRWTPGLWRPAVPSLAVMLLVMLGSVLLLLPRGLIPRWLALTLFVPLIWPSPPQRPALGEFEVQFLDVGQGLAAVVHTRHHDLLFDTGPALGPDFDAAQAAILPYLYQRRVRALDVVMISHWHADHSGGLASVLEQMPVQMLMAGGGMVGGGVVGGRMAGITHPVHQQACEAGQHWERDGVRFSVLYPPVGLVSTSPNNQSCVLLVSAGQQQLLLTGDIEASAERWLLANVPDQLAASVLQAPHHGSRSSSTSAFIQAVSPAVVVIPAGHHNRFDHPHTEVVLRYQQAGARLYRTGSQGGLQFRLGGELTQPLLLSAHRRDARRYWFNLPEVASEQGIAR